MRAFIRFQHNRYFPQVRQCTEHRPCIFGFTVRRPKAARRHWRHHDRKFNPLWGQHRWVNREWCDDWRPFRPLTAKQRRDDLLLKIQLNYLYGRVV